MAGFGSAVKHLLHHGLPFLTVGFYPPVQLINQQVADLMGQHVGRVSLLIVSKQYRMKIYPVLLQKRGACMAATASEGQSGAYERSPEIAIRLEV